MTPNTPSHDPDDAMADADLANGEGRPGDVPGPDTEEQDGSDETMSPPTG